MSSRRLFTLQTAALHLLVSLVIAFCVSSTQFAFADFGAGECTTAGGTWSDNQCKCASGQTITSGGGKCTTANSCTEEVLKDQELVLALDSYCGDINSKNRADCRKKALECNHKIQAAEDAIKGEGDDANDTGLQDCDSIKEVQSQCPGAFWITPEEAQRNKHEIDQLRKDLQKEKSDNRKDQTDRLQNQNEDANKMQDDANKSDQEYRKSKKEITDKMQQDLADIGDAKLKSLKQAQDDYDKIDVEYITLRNDLRRKTSKANDTQLSWSVQCYSAADTVAQQTSDAFDARMAAEDAQVRNYQFASSAGKLNRQLKLKRQKILNKYNEFLSACLAGKREPGASIKLALSQAQNDVKDSLATATDRGNRLEKLRQQILTNLGQLKQSLDQKSQMLMQQSQEALTMLDQDHQTEQNRMMQRQMQSMQQKSLQTQQDGQSDKEMQARLQQLQKDEAAASAQAKCMITRDKDEIVAKKKQLDDARKALQVLAQGCKSVPPPKDAPTTIPETVSTTPAVLGRTFHFSTCDSAPSGAQGIMNNLCQSMLDTAKSTTNRNRTDSTNTTH